MNMTTIIVSVDPKDILSRPVDEIFKLLTIDNIKEIPTKILVDFWNAHHADALIKKFADRKTAEKRILTLVERLAHSEPVSEPTDAPAAPVYKTRASRKVKPEADEPEQESPNADKPEDEISEEEALAELALMRERAKGQETPEKKQERKDAAAAIADSWKDEEVRAARTTRNGVIVTVNGKSAEFTSTRKAFAEFGLPDSKHIRFRMKLKAEKAQVFEHNGNKYFFELVE